MDMRSQSALAKTRTVPWANRTAVLLVQHESLSKRFQGPDVLDPVIVQRRARLLVGRALVDG